MLRNSAGGVSELGGFRGRSAGAEVWCRKGTGGKEKREEGMEKRTWDHAKVDQGEGAIAWLDPEFSSHFSPPLCAYLVF